MNEDSRGLQAERTVLAWQRTALGLAGVSALLLHHASGRVAPSVPGAVGLLTALAVILMARSRLFVGRHLVAHSSPMGAGPIRAMAAITALLSLASAAVVIAGRS